MGRNKGAKKRQRGPAPLVSELAQPNNGRSRNNVNGDGKKKKKKIKKNKRNMDTVANAGASVDIPEHHLKITQQTLEVLGRSSHLFYSGRMRGIRRALHALPSVGDSAIAKLSEWFRDHEWQRVLHLLETDPPSHIPLGALQRWTRDCDAASSGGEAHAFPVLDALLRRATPLLVAPVHGRRLIEPLSDSECPELAAGIRSLTNPALVRYHGWTVDQGDDDQSNNDAVSPSDVDWHSIFYVLLRVAANERTPRNLHDLTLWSCAEASFPLSGAHQMAPSRSHPVPGVPGALLISHAMSAQECVDVVAAAEALGYAPDSPITGLNSVLAHNFCFMVPRDFHEALWGRIAPHLPPRALGFNRRWRMYRYVPGAVYRPHIDGAWPASSIDSLGRYVFNAYDDRYSRYTLVYYFNDLEECQGGATTFFLPTHDRPGMLNSLPVLPRAGCALVFPHGDVESSLLHEGSAVLSGVKYICRTEIMMPK